MKTKVTKLIALALCLTLLVGNAAAHAFAGRESAAKTAAADAQAGLMKDETVYVLAGADGSVQKISVSDWIKNPEGESKITDSGTLTDVENVKGDETYSMNGENMRVWDAQGNDIYCRGSIDKELPVGIRVSYELNGKAISAEELAGKSGTVTIRYTYENYQYETVEIDGKQEKMYVPFAMLTGLLLDGSRFSDVTVTNGRVVNDGTHIVVVGMALPGLEENLQIDAEKLELPESVEITAKVEGFKLGNTVTLATNELFNKLDTESFDSLDGLTDSLGDLTDAMGKLMSGSSELYEGLCTLLEKSGQLVDGIHQMAAGAEALKNGAAQVDDGAAALVSGSQELASGLGTLSANSASLNGGAAVQHPAANGQYRAGKGWLGGSDADHRQLYRGAQRCDRFSRPGQHCPADSGDGQSAGHGKGQCTARCHPRGGHGRGGKAGACRRGGLLQNAGCPSEGAGGDGHDRGRV